MEELKRLLEVENVKSYVRFTYFIINYLEKAHEEINYLTDLNISYKPITKGKKVIKIEFQIDTKSPIDRAIAGATANDRLNNTARN